MFYIPNEPRELSDWNTLWASPLLILAEATGAAALLAVCVCVSVCLYVCKCVFVCFYGSHSTDHCAEIRLRPGVQKCKSLFFLMCLMRCLQYGHNCNIRQSSTKNYMKNIKDMKRYRALVIIAVLILYKNHKHAFQNVDENEHVCL